MKKVILLALLMPFTANGQIIENFEQGNANNWVQSTDGHWKADASASLSGSYSLHHIFDNPDAGTDRTGIRIKSLHPSEGLTRWSFTIRYGYDPSSLNNWSVFLISDTGPEGMSPDGSSNGYALGVNLTGSDDTLRLWKVKGAQLTALVNCRINWQTDIGITNIVRIVIERTPTGTWSISVFRVNGNLLTMTTGNDNELFTTGWFGIYYRYSATRDRLLWVDDISIDGVFYEDNSAPVIKNCVASGSYSVNLTLDEEPSEAATEIRNYYMNSEDNSAKTVTKINGLNYQIEFNMKLIDKTVNKLFIKSLCDRSGNCANDIRIEFTPVLVERGDVVISEIMADPTPEVSLPGKEYIEIINRTGFSYNLKNWKLSTADQDYLFPETSINPLDVMIICSSQDTSLFKSYGKVTGLKQFPSLTDQGRMLFISDSTGTLIHGVEYSSDWYMDDLKSRGGWSLEMIDTRFPFSGEGNWKASESKKGGTPGAANSVAEINSDDSFSGIQNVFPDDSVSIRIRFSEPVFALLQEEGKIKVAGNNIDAVCNVDPLCMEYNIRLANPLQKGKIYSIEVPADICDFAGNKIQKSEFSFGLTQKPDPGEVLFNEILFNPWPGDPDYVEFFNCSDKIFDASRLQLNSINDVTGDLSETVMVSGERRCFLPGSYFAISTDIKKVKERYFSSDPENLFGIATLPSMPDDKGHLILFSRELDRIDEVSYNEKMHFSLLSSFEGVALEKILPQSKSEEPANWHSASENSGWGTPGAPNSVLAEVRPASDKIVLSSSRITPDNDGNEDFLTINFNLEGSSNILSVTVFDERGTFVKKVVSNQYAGPGSSVIWDGTAEDGSMVNTGIYIVLITVFDDAGKTNRWKKVCTVIRKSN